jgi:hypothetical protein
MSVAINTYYTDSHVCIAFWQNVAIVDIAAELDAPRMLTLEAAYRRLLEVYPRGIAALALIRAGTPVSGPAARAEGARFTKELGDQVLQVAMVIEERGIGAQMLRAVVRGVNVLVRQTRLQLFDGVDDAVAGTARHVASPALSPADVAAELRAAVAAVRNGFQPEPARLALENRWF